MPARPKPCLFVVAGDVSPGVRALIGDYPERLRELMALDAGQVRVARVHRGDALPPPGRVRAAVITGSPAMLSDPPPWCRAAAAWLRDALRRGLPLFGFCFGHQLLAHACGGRVERLPGGPEYGTVQVRLDPEAAAGDPLFAGLPPAFAAQESHFEAVTRLPPGAVRLGSSPEDPNHVIRFADRAWGVQFHPERNAAAAGAALQSNAKTLAACGRDVAALRRGLRESPEAAALLRRFAELATST